MVGLIIYGILVLCLIALLCWVIMYFIKNPSRIKVLFKKMEDLALKERHEYKKQEILESSQKEIIRSIVKEEVERVGNIIICSFPQQTNINQNKIINEIKYNRQLLERIIVSLDKKQEKVMAEIVEPKIKQYPIIKFARMIDSSSPLGFQAVSLSDISRGSCYQIMINSESQASYRLITDLAIQREIIAMFNPIITLGCEYDETPAVINEIVPIKDGLLELHSGVWHIVKKTKIRFI